MLAKQCGGPPRRARRTLSRPARASAGRARRAAAEAGAATEEAEAAIRGLHLRGDAAGRVLKALVKAWRRASPPRPQPYMLRRACTDKSRGLKGICTATHASGIRVSADTLSPQQRRVHEPAYWPAPPPLTAPPTAPPGMTGRAAWWAPTAWRWRRAGCAARSRSARAPCSAWSSAARAWRPRYSGVCATSRRAALGGLCSDTRLLWRGRGCRHA